MKGDGADAKGALLNQPKAVALDATGNMFVADSRNHRIRRIDVATGFITTVAGTGMAGFAGDGAAPLAASFHMQLEICTTAEDGKVTCSNENPEPGGGITLDDRGNLYVADTYNNRIRKIDLTEGVVSTIAGTGAPAFSGDGGPALAATLSMPRDLEFRAGRLYIADTDNHSIRVIDLATGIIQTVAGTGQRGFAGDGGPATQASLYRPFGVALDPEGNLYVADTFNNRIRRINQ
jgi:DNA-binding beta-propeller fold protein YncE